MPYRFQLVGKREYHLDASRYLYHIVICSKEWHWNSFVMFRIVHLLIYTFAVLK